MWQCGHCQDINDGEVGVCPACGRGDAQGDLEHVDTISPRQLYALPAIDPVRLSHPAEASAAGVRGQLAGKARWFVQDARKWAAGKTWWWRGLLVIYIAWAGWQHMVDPMYADPTGALTLCVHELGHFVTGWAPEPVCVAAGSVFQVLAPLYIVYSFVKQREYFGLTVAGFWLSSSLYAMAAYIADARAQQLDLVNLAHEEHGIHDWNYMLGAVGLLPYDTLIGGFVGLIASAIMFVSIGWGAWICWPMFKNRRSL